jgi:hypothetical protein
LATKKEQSEKTAEQVTSAEKRSAELNGELSACSSKSNTLLEEKDSLAKESSNQKEKIAALSKDISNLEVDKGGMQQEIEGHKKHAKSLEDKMAELHSQIAALRSSADDKQQLHDTLQKQHQALDKAHKNLKKSHRLLESKYADPSVQHFLRAKAVKVYSDPGIEGAANKTFRYVVPTLRDRYVRGQQLINASEKAVYSRLNAFVGTSAAEPWLPAVSGCLVYGTVIAPFVLTMCCLTRTVCKLRPLLLFCHVDFLLTALLAGIFAASTGKEPLATFAHHDAAVYLFTQAVFAIVICFYAILLFLAYCLSKTGREGLFRCLQILGVTPIVAIYYVHVWTPAMLDEMPHIDNLVVLMVGEGSAVSKFAWLPYLPVAVLFLIILHLERLCWNASVVKDNQISIVMRDEVELTSMLPKVGDIEEDVHKKA